DWSENKTVYVHPASICLGTRLSETIKNVRSQAGDIESNGLRAPQLELIVTDLKGRSLPNNRVVLKADRVITHQDENGKITTTYAPAYEGDVLSGETPVAVPLKFLNKGIYRLTTTSFDKQERKVQNVQILAVARAGHERVKANLSQRQTRTTRTVPVASNQSNTNDHRARVKITSDKLEYKLGETAQISVQVPLEHVQGLLFISNGETIVSRPIKTETGKIREYIKVTRDQIGSVRIIAVLSGSKGSFVAETSYRVSKDSLSGSISVICPKQVLKPGETATVSFRALDDKGRACKNAQIAVAIVDENVLALTGYAWSNPLDSFYNDTCYMRTVEDSTARLFSLSLFKYLTREMNSSRQTGQLASLSSVDRYSSGGMIGAPINPRFGQMSDLSFYQPTCVDERHYTSGTGDSAPSLNAAPTPSGPFTVRSNFDPLAYFNAAVTTDESGFATIQAALPGNLTRYKVMAVFVKGSETFGSGTGSFVTSEPLLVRATPPRFLNKEDVFELPITVQNNEPEEISADIIARSPELTFLR
ncbi:MAG TPA: alpha-2-macroglobulin family protein, partial [Chroococcales cyanobacterium]